MGLGSWGLRIPGTFEKRWFPLCAEEKMLVLAFWRISEVPQTRSKP